MKSRFSIVVFLFLYAFTAHAEEVKVLSSNQNSMTFEYKPEISDTIYFNTPQGNFVKVSMLNVYVARATESGKYYLPAREVNVGVQGEFGNNLTIVDSEFGYLDGILLPLDKTEDDLKSYDGSSYWEESDLTGPAVLAEFGYVRNLPVQSIKLNPIQYDNTQKRIKVFTKIVVRVSFNSAGGNFTKINDTRLTNSVLNFDVAKNWGKSDSKTRLMKNESSVLADGTWYRFECLKEGMYRITRSMLSQFGIEASSVDPRTIKIYNNGGYQLPESISDARPEDLEEIAIYVEGENDGVFNENDYVLFYGRPTVFYEYSDTGQTIIRKKNQFSRKNYFWITSAGTIGKRITGKTSVSGTATHQQNSTVAFKFKEDDIVNIGESGRDWWGDSFSPTSPERTYLTPLDSWIPGTEIKYDFRVVNKSKNSVVLKMFETDTEIYSSSLQSVTSEYGFGASHQNSTVYNQQLSSSRSNLKLRLVNPSSTVEVLLDYIDITYTRELRASGDSLMFFSDQHMGVIQYNMNNFSSSEIKVFDISDYKNVKQITGGTISGGNFSFRASENYTIRNKYIGCTSSAYLTPQNISTVENTNIRGITNGAELIVITHPLFMEWAEDFKNYRMNESSNSVSAIVVNVEDIYNEFSGGSLDPAAIRNFLQYAYENWNTRPFYVLLFGDGHYDYYDIQHTASNYIPAYELSQSLDEINSFPSDDFYARISGDDIKADVAIGRINVQSAEDAEVIINKIKAYERDPDRSLWKNTITLVADDGPTSRGDDGKRHTQQSEILATSVIPSYIIENKIYLSAYPTVITGEGRRKPDVNRAIIDAVNQGTLMLNFIGHGDPQRWTHENVFTSDVSIPQLQNDKYFFLTAATCDYGKYDQVTDQSATETMLLIPGGTIGALTAVRPVYSNQNAILNETFYRNLFDNSGNPYYCIGDAYLVTKQTRTQDNDEKFHLFGDPTLRLNVPTVPVSVDSVNSESLGSVVNISALGNVHIKGKVHDGDGNVVNLEGESIISVYDSDKIIQLPDMDYFMYVQGGVIFKGRATVHEGEYEISFVVPKDIAYADSRGRILAYVYSDEVDGLGFSRNIIVGGADETIDNDGNGPEIEVFYDDFEFDKSYVVSPDFTLLISLEDETGLNTTGTGVGHRLEGILNNDVEHPIDFSNYFISDLDTGGKSGKVDYRFTNLQPGEYSLKVKAWDVFNNLSVVESFFSVTDESGLAVENVVNYPNPFTNNTTFTFQHNLSAALNVNIKIYTVAGRMIKEIEEFGVFEKFVRIDWDGRDEDGNLAANGTYLYKVNVETVDAEYTKNVLGKLSIIR